jgi:hypothetical protein
MELINVNPNGDNIVASNLIKVNFIIENYQKLSSKMKIICFYFLKDAMIAQKTKFLIV